MRRTLCAEEASELTIKFRDKTYIATFNMKAVAIMQGCLENIGLEKLSYEHFAGIVLYSAVKVNYPDYTEEEANAVIMSIRPADITAIIDEYMRSVTGCGIQHNEDELKKIVALVSKMKSQQKD